MPRYKNIKISSDKIETEASTHNVETFVDTLGYTTLEFGASFSLRLDYNNIEKLQEILTAAKYKIEEDSIDLAAQHLDNEDYTYKNPNDPSNW